MVYVYFILSAYIGGCASALDSAGSDSASALDGGACSAVEVPSEADAKSVGDYLCLCGVKLAAKSETTNEEFELYVEKSNEAASVSPYYTGFPTTTSIQLNGQLDVDAAGKPSTLVDVNTNGVAYCANKRTTDGFLGVALVKFDKSSCYYSVLPVEDDGGDAKLTMATCGRSATLHYSCVTNSAVSSDRVSSQYAYSRLTNSTNTGRYTYYRCTTTVYDSDDFYGDVFYDFTSAMPAAVTAYKTTKTTGVTLWMGRSSNCSSLCAGWSDSGSCAEK